ncbi:MAG: penicillin-binding protein 1C [Deltaproteobacteria bacterium]|nr:penicillin-binding protein 1C [Deltaproteobacteria bacterium]
MRSLSPGRRRAVAWAAAGVVLLALAGVAALELWARLAPGELPPAGWSRGQDTLVLAGDGAALGDLAHPRQRSGPWLAAGEVPPLVQAAALAAEDHRFHHHGGVDPLALARAAWGNLVARRVIGGGSTITMQLARLLRPAPRNLASKLREAVRALWLEAHLSKNEILAQYLNRAPFGGPLVGLGAASRELLGKAPAALAPHEAATLLALPQDPSRLLQAAHRPRLLARRNQILRGMTRAGALTPAARDRAIAAPLVLAGPPPPPLAPHFLAALRARLPRPAPGRVTTCLDPEIEALAAQALAAHVKLLWDSGLREAALVVLRNSDRAIVAYVGSPDFANPAAGQVDGVLARRQPGSSLKPFIYALALQEGRTLADLLADEPLGLLTSGGVFRPEDYDGRHRGAVRLKVALASSLNLPALRTVEELGPQAVLDQLRDLGFSLPQSGEHYGLGLALGDGEVSLLELTTAYAALADNGRWAPARWWTGQPATPPVRVFTPAAARLVTQALSEDPPRALGFGRHTLLELPFPVAVKTGTSQRHRDSWCVGFTRDYTVGVWVGNFSGDPMAGLSGLSGAAPLWRSVFLSLHRHGAGELPPWPGGVVRRRICLATGQLAAAGCPHTALEYFDATQALPPACMAHGPALAQDAAAQPGAVRLELLSPLPGASFARDPDLPPHLQVLTCRARLTGQLTGAFWRLDGRPLPPGPEPLTQRLPLTPGPHTLSLTALTPRGSLHQAANFYVW